MAQPTYPLFSKRLHREQRGKRGGYNFEKTREYHLAEKWFEERKSRDIPSEIVTTPIQKRLLPPGLEKLSKICITCKKIPQIPITVNCCNTVSCVSCFTHYTELYNRCTKCKSVIDMEKYDLYDGFDLNIPSYDDFEYSDPGDNLLPVTHIPLNTVQKTLSVDAEEFIPQNFRSDDNILLCNQTPTDMLDLNNILLNYVQLIMSSMIYINV